MEDIRIYCENTKDYYKVALGSTLKDIAATLPLQESQPVIAALVDNKLKSLNYTVIAPHQIRFIGYDHPDGRRTYIRSLCFNVTSSSSVMKYTSGLPSSSGLTSRISQYRPLGRE